MRVAVLGVGLIGGSIGLAARGRLDAEVAGFDPDTELLAKAEELGAISAGRGSVAEAVGGAEVVFCAAPVGALPKLAAEALDAAGEETAVTDVGSVKAEAIAALGQDPRFIGGHPLAGAETSGVENARADLFEGARWYLTPTPSTGGLLYDRVQRLIADLGARPQAIEAESPRPPDGHGQPPAARAGERARQPGDGRAWRRRGRAPARGRPELSRRDQGRRRQPGDLGRHLRRATARWSPPRSRRPPSACSRRRSCSAEATARRFAPGTARRGSDRRGLLEGELAGGRLCELRVLVPNSPGVVAEIALALGRAGVNIEDMGLYPAADMRSGAISLFVAGEEEAERAATLVRELGHDVSRVER